MCHKARIKAVMFGRLGFVLPRHSFLALTATTLHRHRWRWMWLSGMIPWKKEVEVEDVVIAWKWMQLSLAPFHRNPRVSWPILTTLPESCPMHSMSTHTS